MRTLATSCLHTCVLTFVRTLGVQLCLLLLLTLVQPEHQKLHESALRVTPCVCGVQNGMGECDVTRARVLFGRLGGAITSLLRLLLLLSQSELSCVCICVCVCVCVCVCGFFQRKEKKGNGNGCCLRIGRSFPPLTISLWEHSRGPALHPLF